MRGEPEKHALTHQEREKADSIRNDLIKIIVDHQLLGFGFGVFLEDYKSMKARGPQERALLGSVPYHLAYQLAMTHAALILHDTDNMKHEVLSFVCDEHEKYSFHAKATYEELKQKNPFVMENMGSLTYADDKNSAAVQMADLMAYEAMRKATQQLDGTLAETPEFTLLKKSVYKIEMCDISWLESYIAVNSKPGFM